MGAGLFSTVIPIAGVYLDLLTQSLALHAVAMMGYCLMSNHVHLILVPGRAESLGLALKHAHGRYASYWNAIHHKRPRVAGTLLFLPPG